MCRIFVSFSILVVFPFSFSLCVSFACMCVRSFLYVVVVFPFSFSLCVSFACVCVRSFLYVVVACVGNCVCVPC